MVAQPDKIFSSIAKYLYDLRTRYDITLPSVFKSNKNLKRHFLKFINNVIIEKISRFQLQFQR